MFTTHHRREGEQQAAVVAAGETDADAIIERGGIVAHRGAQAGEAAFDQLADRRGAFGLDQAGTGDESAVGIGEVDGFAEVEPVDFGDRRAGAEGDAADDVFQTFRGTDAAARQASGKREERGAEQGTTIVDIQFVRAVWVGMECGSTLAADQQGIGTPASIRRRVGMRVVRAQGFDAGFALEQKGAYSEGENAIVELQDRGVVRRYFG